MVAVGGLGNGLRALRFGGKGAADACLLVDPADAVPWGLFTNAIEATGPSTEGLSDCALSVFGMLSRLCGLTVTDAPVTVSDISALAAARASGELCNTRGGDGDANSTASYELAVLSTRSRSGLVGSGDVMTASGISTAVPASSAAAAEDAATVASEKAAANAASTDASSTVGMGAPTVDVDSTDSDGATVVDAPLGGADKTDALGMIRLVYRASTSFVLAILVFVSLRN